MKIYLENVHQSFFTTIFLQIITTSFLFVAFTCLMRNSSRLKMVLEEQNKKNIMSVIST